MNPEIFSIVEDMKNRCSPDPLNPTDIQVYQTAKMARLLSLLAEETQTQSNKISEQTEKLIKLTKVLVCFTLVLFFVGFVQIALMIFKP